MDHLKVSTVIYSSTAVVLFCPRWIRLSVMSVCAAVHSSALASVHYLFLISFHGVEPIRCYQGIGMSTGRHLSFHCPFVVHRTRRCSLIRTHLCPLLFPIRFHGVEPIRCCQGIGMSGRHSSFHFVLHCRPRRPFSTLLPLISLTPTI